MITNLAVGHHSMQESFRDYTHSQSRAFIIFSQENSFYVTIHSHFKVGSS